MPGPSVPPAPHPNLGGVLTQPQTPEPWELPLSSAGPEIPAWGQHNQPCPERPKMPRKWATLREMHRLYTCGTAFKDPSNLGRGWVPRASEAEHKARDPDMNMDGDRDVAETQKQAPMLSEFCYCLHSRNTQAV